MCLLAPPCLRARVPSCLLPPPSPPRSSRPSRSPCLALRGGPDNAARPRNNSRNGPSREFCAGYKRSCACAAESCAGAEVSRACAAESCAGANLSRACAARSCAGAHVSRPCAADPCAGARGSRTRARPQRPCHPNPPPAHSLSSPRSLPLLSSPHEHFPGTGWDLWREP